MPIRKLLWIVASCAAFSIPSLSQISVPIANAGTTGTSLNTLTKLTGAPSTAVIAATTDTSGIVGITGAGAGTSGTAIVVISGIQPCVFDNATVAGDYVQIASGVAGNCHDAGATRPTTGQIIGRVLATGAGTVNVSLTPDTVASTGGGGGSAYPVTVSGTVTSGGIPYFSSTTNQATSAVLAANAPMVGGGAGAAPSTLATTFTTQTDAATVTWAIASAYVASTKLTFTVHSGSRTLNLTGLINGGMYQILLVQDATGGEGLVLGTGCTWKVSGGAAGAVTLSTSANATDRLMFSYDGTNCYADFRQNYN